MQQYLIILLDDISTSFCHYEVKQERRKIIPLNILKKGIRFAMKENLMIHFVYPNYQLPNEYKDLISSIDHYNIVPLECVDVKGDAIVSNNMWNLDSITSYEASVIVRTTKKELFSQYQGLNKYLLRFSKIDIVLTDIESFTNEDYSQYKLVLRDLSKYLEENFIKGAFPQLNILTDRILLSKMNNCGAGETAVTLAPNGKFYICPAFYYDNEQETIGNIESGLNITNKQLYKLNYAPICCHCDAWQCKRCIWLNRKITLEVNTPSHEQCVVSHLERNASRDLLCNTRNNCIFLPKQKDIKEIDYLDPFEKKETWQ